MKPAIVISSIITTCLALYPVFNYAEPANTGQINLDSSKDIFFEQFSSNTFSLELLQNKNQFNNQDLILGGASQFDLQHWQGNAIEISPPPQPYQQSTQFYFTQATFDMMSNLDNKWMTMFVSIADAHIGQNGPDGNNVYIPHAFLLLGNLKTNPFYLTAGIDTIPFGSFSGSGAWDTPLTANYFNPAQSPLLSIGYFKNNLNAIITEYDDQINYAHHAVYTLYYNKTIQSWSYGLGVSYLTHLQSNSTGNASTNPHRNHMAAAFNLGDVWDFNASIGFHNFALTGEYVSGSQAVGVNRNKPQALAETLSYKHSIFSKETTFGVGCSHSLYLHDVPTSLAGQDAVPLAASGIKKSWVLSVTRPIVNKYFMLGFNAERDTLYSEKNTYTYTLDLMAYL